MVSFVAAIAKYKNSVFFERAGVLVCLNGQTAGKQHSLSAAVQHLLCFLNPMNWLPIRDPRTLEEIKHLSAEHTVLIFKHSTRCSISMMALDRLERAWKDSDTAKIKPYFLDLLSYRHLSNQIAQDFGVEHQSPQVIVIRQGKVLYHQSHYGIQYADILQATHQN